MKIITAPYLFTVVFMSLSACSLIGPTDSIAVEWPEVVIPALSGVAPEYWELQWLTEKGRSTGLVVDGQSRPVLSLTREYPIVLTASPRDPSLPDVYRIKPAGFLLPAVRDSPSEISLNWEDGFAAQKILELAAVGVSPMAINLERFVNAVNLRGEDMPWDINQRRLWDDLLTGRLWVYSFQLLPRHTVHLPLPPGIWHGEYVGVSELAVGSDGWRGELVEGIHYFFCPATGGTASVFIEGDGRVTYLIDS